MLFFTSKNTLPLASQEKTSNNEYLQIIVNSSRIKYFRPLFNFVVNQAILMLGDESHP